MKPFNFLKLLFIVLLFSTGLKAQGLLDTHFTEDYYRKIPTGTVYLVLTGNKTFDEHFQKAVTDLWTVTPVKVIQARDIEKYMGNDNNFFITSMKIKYIRPVKLTLQAPQPGDVMIMIAFFNGKFKKMDDYVPEYMMETYCYKMYFDEKVSADALDYAVKYVNDNVVQDIVKGKDATDTRLDNPEALKTKTLLISKFEFDHFMKQSALDKYKYKYKVLSSEELAKKFKANDPGYCYMDCSWGSVRIFDMETKACIYAFTTNMLFKAKEKDFTDLNDCIDGNCKPCKIIHLRYDGGGK